jgi:hypothetical protein
MRVSIRPDPLTLTGNGSTYILIAAWIYANIPSLKWLFESLRSRFLAVGAKALLSSRNERQHFRIKTLISPINPDANARLTPRFANALLGFMQEVYCSTLNTI